jgi:hypothetical protein
MTDEFVIPKGGSDAANGNMDEARGHYPIPKGGITYDEPTSYVVICFVDGKAMGCSRHFTEGEAKYVAENVASKNQREYLSKYYGEYKVQGIPRFEARGYYGPSDLVEMFLKNTTL